MFNGTLRYNLDPENKAKEDQIWEILRAAKLDNLIAEEGLKMKIQENGCNLSSGEK